MLEFDLEWCSDGIKTYEKSKVNLFNNKYN